MRECLWNPGTDDEHVSLDYPLGNEHGVVNIESESLSSLRTAALHVMCFFAIHRVLNVVTASNAMIGEEHNCFGSDFGANV